MGGTLESHQSKIAGVYLTHMANQIERAGDLRNESREASNKENSQFVYVGLEEKSSATLAISAEKAL